MMHVVGYHTTPFGELWDDSLFGLVKKVIDNLLADANLDIKEIDAIFFANMLGGVLENNLHAGAKIAEMTHTNIPVFRVESACASGGMAFHLAQHYLLGQRAKTILVIGAEKMTDYAPEQVVTGLAAAASGEEQEAGLTFPGLYAMMAQVYLQKFGYTERDLAAVPVKNHYHGTLNEKAQFKRIITVEQVINSPYVASPLKVLDSSPISDGAAGVVLSTDPAVVKKIKHKTPVLACEVATDSISLSGRRALDSIEATKIAADKAFVRAEIAREDIGVAEVHDCFSIAEIIAMEDLGFYKHGEAARHIVSGETTYGRSNGMVVNTSGGLKAAGHPVGATGIKQIGEVYLQLTNQAGRRQVKSVRYGLAHNVGGSGGTAVVTILGG